MPGVSGSVIIRRADALSEDEIGALAALLVSVVAEGASVGYLAPLDPERARAYWRRVRGSSAALVLAEIDGELVGTVQLQAAESENGGHRGEVCKLLVDPRARRRGVGRALLARAEAEGTMAGKSLLVLDTREGDPSNDLYRSAGWTVGGRIPDWARSSSGELAATVFWFKSI
ncbi:MAG: GNAT family N-acetyltransferase [Thermomicrobiales bacterium]